MTNIRYAENPRQASGFNAQKPQVVRVGRDQVGNTRTHIRLSAPLCGANNWTDRLCKASQQSTNANVPIETIDQTIETKDQSRNDFP